MERATGFEPRSVAGSALKPASRLPQWGQPPRALPTKGAHPLRNPLSRVQNIPLERATGFEPATASLEGWNSTTELRPPSFTRAECPGLRTERRAKTRPPTLYSYPSTSSPAPPSSGGGARNPTLGADCG